jgi:hypothetical protein
MLLKVIIGLLIVLLAMESSYILIHHHPVSRFKTVGEDGFVAFDTATGQLCRTFPAKTASNDQRPTSLDASPKRQSNDPFLDEIQKLGLSAKDEDDATVAFVRGLPACGDIR